jgi:aspartyl-tRNA synthetase
VTTRTPISKLRQHVGQEVNVCGWAHAIRDHKHVQFIILRDSTGQAQATLEKTSSPFLAEAVSSLTRESAVRAVGHVRENPQVRLGGIEMMLTDLVVEGPATSPMPIDPFAGSLPGLDNRLDWRHLDLRRPENQLLLKVQTTVVSAMRSFWISEGFQEIHTSKLMGTASESGAELFEVDYFGSAAYLAQSPQFYKQMAIASGFERVFEIAPVFRADPSFTTRHTTEFTSVDVEMAWIDSHEDVMVFEERWLSYVLEAVAQEHGAQIADAFAVEVVPPVAPFPRIPFADAIVQISQDGREAHVRATDLDSQGERSLGAWIQREQGHEFVFITDYPTSGRPFYHMRQAFDPKITRSFDLLWKGLEITTGAQREHRPGVLERQAHEKGLRSESIGFYLDFFRYGCPPHGGFGLGLARLLMVLLGFSNVREATLLPRAPNRLHP